MSDDWYGDRGYNNRSQGGSRGYDRENRPSREFHRGGGNQYGGNSRGQSDWGGSENFEMMKVQSRFVGRIIGRGGSKISELQNESGARINVTKETEGDETFIKLSGDDEAISKAKMLIDRLCL